MADKKFSVTLSAREQMSTAFASAGTAADRLGKEIERTNRQIKALGSTSKRASDFGSLRKEMEGTKAHWRVPGVKR
ncbi:hypothetical protein ACM3C4_01130 [Edwardsiella ictaluri]